MAVAHRLRHNRPHPVYFSFCFQHNGLLVDLTTWSLLDTENHLTAASNMKGSTLRSCTTGSRRLWPSREGNTSNEPVFCLEGLPACSAETWRAPVRSDVRAEAGGWAHAAAGMCGPSSQEEGRTRQRGPWRLRELPRWFLAESWFAHSR